MSNDRHRFFEAFCWGALTVIALEVALVILLKLASEVKA